MAADSSSAGYIRSGAAPPYDVALEDLFQGVIVGITGLPGSLVRPRFQPNPPNMPGFDVDWCAFGVAVQQGMWNSFRTMNRDGSYTVEGQEAIEVKASFYGPNHAASARGWRDGMQIGQNRDALVNAKMEFISFADSVVIPALLKEQWVRRTDVVGTFHRWAVRVYPILSFAYADVDINNEQFHDLISTEPPPA